MIDLLLHYQADVGLQTEGGAQPGQTPLHLAAYNGLREVMVLLLAHKADVNAKGMAVRKHGAQGRRRESHSGPARMAHDQEGAQQRLAQALPALGLD